MSQRSLTRALLTPSLLSGYLVFGLALIILGLSGWSYVTKGEMLHDYLFGPFGVITAMLYAPDFFAIFRRTIINNPFTYNVFILVSAIIVGLLVYQLLESIRRFARNTSVVWYEFHEHTPQARQALTESLVRLIVRVISVIGLMLFTLFMVNILVPFCILMVENSIDQLGTSPLLTIGLSLLSVIFLTVSLHVTLILIRLTLLRPRIFGGRAVQFD